MVGGRVKESAQVKKNDGEEAEANIQERGRKSAW
jgi:hypothetical protein